MRIAARFRLRLPPYLWYYIKRHDALYQDLLPLFEYEKSLLVFLRYG